MSKLLKSPAQINATHVYMDITHAYADQTRAHTKAYSNY